MTTSGNVRFLVLDAMGVMHQNADDVTELLIPFVQQHNPDANNDVVQHSYRLASLGILDTHDFWRQVGVDPAHEDDYLASHMLTPGLTAFLDWASGMGFGLACLSNDVSMWSRKLRHRFGLSERFEKWVISGDVGVRKPDPGIYLEVLQQLGVSAAELLFVDDRLANVEAARRLGIRSLHFSDDLEATSEELVCRGFQDLRRCIEFAGAPDPCPRHP